MILRQAQDDRADCLYLGSQSKARQKLLELAGIKFKILQHKSSECVIEPDGDFEKYVISIACDKIQHLQLPETDQIPEDTLFVVTADTLIKTVETNQILGKPKDLEEAKEMLASFRHQPVFVLTGCCLRVMKKSGQHWDLEKQECWATGAQVEFVVDPDSMDSYFKNEPWALQACGAGIIEGYGQSFLKSINGSYTAVLGLPLFELRQKLKAVGFKFKS
jgi:septum formation protein